MIGLIVRDGAGSDPSPSPAAGSSDAGNGPSLRRCAGARLQTAGRKLSAGRPAGPEHRRYAMCEATAQTKKDRKRAPRSPITSRDLLTQKIYPYSIGEGRIL